MPEAADLRKKNDLERKLLASMRGLFRRLGRELFNALAKGQPLPDLIILAQSSIEARLKDHYRRCERVFGTNLSAQFDADIEPGKVEAQYIRIEILRVLDERAVRQAQMIARTSQNLALRAWQKANVLTVNSETLTARDVPRLTATLFATSSLAQAGAVATTETQMGSETCKGIEAHMLVGDTTIEIKRRGSIITAQKIWRSQGDSRVRTTDSGGKFDHLAADGQSVDSAKSFSVGGERLLWPGDISLGASAGNIINCRCSAIYDKEGFLKLRRSFLANLFADVLQPFRPTESTNIVGTGLGVVT